MIVSSKNALLALCLSVYVPVKSMEPIRRVLKKSAIFSQPTQTLAQRIAHAMVNKNVQELKDILLSGYDIHTKSASFRKELKEEVKKLLLKGKRPSELPECFKEALPYPSFFESTLMSQSHDWLLDHGLSLESSLVLYEPHLDYLSRMLVLVSEDESLNWINSILAGKLTLPYQDHLKREIVIKRIVLLASAQGRAEVVNLILNSHWDQEITNEMLTQALTRSALPGHTIVVQLIIKVLTARFMNNEIGQDELIHSLRTALTWAAVQGRVETVTLLLKAAQLLDLGIGWEPVGDRVLALIKDNHCLDESMKDRLLDVLDLLSDYAISRQNLLYIRNRRELRPSVAPTLSLPKEIVESILRLQPLI